jgi:HK97 family phage prohead protease
MPVAVAPSSYDEASRTVEAVISTGASVTRSDKFGPYIERLDLSAINPDDLIGVPVQLDHDRSVRSTVGTVIAAARDASGITATIQLTGAADAAPIRERVADGTLSAVSIGYAVSKWAEGKEAGQRVRTAHTWRVQEISLVSIGADPNAKLRGSNMEDETTEMSESQQQQIRSLAELAGLTRGFAEDLIDAGASLDDAREAARSAITSRQQQTPRIRVAMSHEDPAAIRSRREDAIFARASGTAPADHAREFMGDSLRDHARGVLESNGVSTRGMTADDVFTRALGTSDFPQLLTGVGRRTLMAAYTAAESPLKRLARQSSMTDFRSKTSLKLSDTGPLQKLSEHGEIQHTTRSEVKEGYSLDTYASMFAITRKALINDDLGAFNDWGAVAGRAAAETEANLLVSLLTQGAGKGPVMGETGKRLFHADHGNLTTDWDMAGVDWLSDGRLGMRRQKGLDGKTPLNVSPKFILARPEDETTIEQFIALVYATQPADVNIFTGKYELLVEPRLTAHAAYMFADPAQFPVLEYSYLASAPGPQIASQAGWETLGMEFRVFLDFGAGAVDYRGAHRFEA